MTKDPRPAAQSMSTMWYRQALQKNSQVIIDHLTPHEIRVTLLQKNIITLREREELQRENSNHGNIAETEKLLDFLLCKEEAKIKEFVYILATHKKSSYKSLGKLLNDTQTNLAKGIGITDDSELQGITHKLRESYHEKKFCVECPIPNDDSLRIDVADRSRILYYKCKAQMINQERLDELKAKTHPKYITPEYDDLVVERIEEVLQPQEKLVLLKKEILPPKLYKRCSSLAFSQMVSSEPFLQGKVTDEKTTVSSFRRVKSAGAVNLLNNSKLTNQEQDSSSPQPCSEASSTTSFSVFPKWDIVSPSKGVQEDGEITLAVPVKLATDGASQLPGSSDPQTRLYVCAGDAGMGKTTLLKRLAYKWAMQESTSMLRFSAVFVIPLRSVNFEGTLADLIVGIGLLSKDDAEYLMTCMNNSDIASNILFMLDGCDEVKIPPESALWQLIEGSLFPGTHVFVTVRPDTAMYKKLYQLHPFAMVKMIGTETESIRHYLKTNLKLNTDAVDSLLEKNLFDFDILSKPLYLTMFCAMYDKDIPIKIPDSNTDLFNGFMTMVVKRETQRFEIMKTSKFKQSKAPEAANTEFKKSPLEPESTIPTDIKHNIYFVGKMAYEGLLKNKQTFTGDDLQEYMLTDKILTCTGLFCFGKDEENRQTSFFRHKLMQEYMAALYIAKEGFRIQSLCEMIEKASKSQRPSLQTIFAKVQQPIQMACGLSFSFYRDLLKKAKPFTSITKDKFQECNIQTQFEFSLCFEAGCKHEEVAKEMEDYMLEVPVIERDIGGHEPVSSYHKKCISLVTSCFSHGTCKELLMKWFDINAAINTRSQTDNSARILYPVHTSQTAEHIAHSFNICNGIGLVCMSMLSRFSFQDVTTLNIRGERGIVDIQRFFVIFPRLKDIDMYVSFPVDLLQDMELKQRLDQGEYCKSVKRFTQKGRTHTKLPLPSISCLMSQSELEYLNLYGVDILSHIPDGLPCRWNNVTTLKMIWCGITKKNTQKVVNILKHTPKLTLLDLSENQSLEIDTLSVAMKELSHLSTLNLKNIGLTNEKTSKLFALFKNAKNVTHLNLSDNRELDASTLCQAIAKHLHDLEELKLFRSLNYDGSVCLAEHLPSFKNLKRLGIYGTDIQKAEDKLVEKLQLTERMAELEIQVAEWQFDTALSVQQKQKLHVKRIKVFELATE